MNKLVPIFALFVSSILLAFPVSAEAHLNGGGGMVSGLVHPLLGVDHLLAMVAVGVLSVLIGYNAKKAASSLRLLKYSGLAISIFGIYFLINI